MPISLLDIISHLTSVGWMVVVGSFLTMLLSGVVYWQDFTKRSSKFFFIFGIINFVWGLAYGFFEGVFTTPDVYTGFITLYITAAIVPPFTFLFLYVFSVEKAKLPFIKIATYFVPYFIIVGILLYAPESIVSYQKNTETVGKVVFGKLFFVYATYILAYLVAGLYLLAKKYRLSAGIYKIAIYDLLVAFCTACLLAVLMSLFSPMFGGGHDLFWVGHAAVILLMFWIARILMKYNFWSFKLITTEFFITIILITLLAESFFAMSELDLLIKTAITLLIVFSSFFLVGSVKREIQSKYKIENLIRSLDDMHARLKVLDKKKSDFLSIASHHLRDPLTAIKGYASMLLEGSFGELSEQVRQAIEKIFDSSNRLITMVSDFMDISNIESGDMKYKFVDVDIYRIVSGLVSEMKQNADRARLHFEFTADGQGLGDTSYITVGDAGKLRQVFSNLIDNSIKYTPHGSVSVLLSKSADGKKIIFSVSDTGIGMNELTKEKIFRKFSRAEGVNRVYTEGTGLGLYVAKEIIGKHEGRVWAESKGEGHGSSFFVELEAKP